MWGLKETPIIYLDPLAEHVDNPGDSYVQATYKLRGTGGVKYETVINPTIKSEISSEGTSYSLVRIFSLFLKGLIQINMIVVLWVKEYGEVLLNDSHLLYKDNDDVAIYIAEF